MNTFLPEGSAPGICFHSCAVTAEPTLRPEQFCKTNLHPPPPPAKWEVTVLPTTASQCQMEPGTQVTVTFLPTGVLPGERPDEPLPCGQGSDDPTGSVRDDPPDLWERRVCSGEKRGVWWRRKGPHRARKGGEEWGATYRQALSSSSFGNSLTCYNLLVTPRLILRACGRAQSPEHFELAGVHAGS